MPPLRTTSRIKDACAGNKCGGISPGIRNKGDNRVMSYLKTSASYRAVFSCSKARVVTCCGKKKAALSTHGVVTKNMCWQQRSGGNTKRIAQLIYVALSATSAGGIIAANVYRMTRIVPENAA